MEYQYQLDFANAKLGELSILSKVLQQLYNKRITDKSAATIQNISIAMAQIMKELKPFYNDIFREYPDFEPIFNEFLTEYDQYIEEKEADGIA